MIASSRMQRMPFVAGLLGALSLAGCGDFAHTNPLDREVSVAVEVTGPDSVFSYRDTVVFVAHTLPSYAPERVVWSSSGSLNLVPIGNGAFYVSSAQPASVVSGALRVEVDGRAAAHVLTFVHRATSMKVSVCGSQSRTPAMDALGRQVPLCVQGFDARGYPAPVEGTPIVTVSDTSVVAPMSTSAGPGIRSVANGTAKVWLFLRGMSDSLTATVWQRIDSVTLDPAGCQVPGLPLYIGDSVQVSPTNRAFDPGGFVIADTARVRAAVRGMTFAVGDAHNGSVKVTPAGMVTAVQVGWFPYVVGWATTPEEGMVRGVCFLQVNYRP